MADPSWIAQHPSVFDIVTCFFPEREGAEEMPKLRPSLVLEVLKGRKTGAIACRIAYGTRNLKFVQRKDRDVIIQNAADLVLVGLPMATRFDLDNTLVLPWQPEFFGCWTGYDHPKIGQLTETYVKDYAYTMMLRQGT
jgi:hypothetical protein